MNALRDIGLRPAGEEDREFLLTLFADARERASAFSLLPPEQARQLTRMQFEAQRRDYLGRFPHAADHVILVGGRPGGHLYIDRRAATIAIVDIALLPEFRGAGIGLKIVSDLQEEAAAAEKSVTGCVDRLNPARHFWQRMGFQLSGDDPFYFAMEWRAALTPRSA